MCSKISTNVLEGATSFGYIKLDAGACNVSNWKNVAAISAGFNDSIALRKDGTVLATGDSARYIQEDKSNWKNIRLPD